MTSPRNGSDVVVTAVARTPFGRFSGALKEISGPRLGALMIDEIVRRSTVPASDIDIVYAGVGMIGSGMLTPARRAVLQSSLPDATPSLAVDRACCSGMTAVGLGTRDIRIGEAEIALCGGFDNLSGTPFLWPRQRGPKPGAVEVEDPLTLRADFLGKAIAAYTGDEALRHGVDRRQQDEWARASHERYFQADDSGHFAFERCPVLDERKVRNAPLLERDESPRRNVSLERLAELPTVYGSPTVTAGNAPGLNDGAAFLALASADAVRARNLPVLGRILGYVQVAGAPTSGSFTPALAIRKLLARHALAPDDLDLIEINEAYAATPLVSTAVMAEGERDRTERLRARTNIHGGAVAIGHPLGASGARIVMTLINGLRKRGGGRGAAAICGGFGQGDAVLIQVED